MSALPGPDRLGGPPLEQQVEIIRSAAVAVFDACDGTHDEDVSPDFATNRQDAKWTADPKLSEGRTQ